MGRATAAAVESSTGLLDFRRMFEAGAVTCAQPGVTKIGGVTAMRQVLALAEAFNVAVVPHAPYFGPGLLATLHLIAASPRPMLHERFSCDLEASLHGDLVDPVRGRMRVPDRPGLGADPDPGVLARDRVA